MQISESNLTYVQELECERYHNKNVNINTIRIKVEALRYYFFVLSHHKII